MQTQQVVGAANVYLPALHAQPPITALSVFQASPYPMDYARIKPQPAPPTVKHALDKTASSAISPSCFTPTKIHLLQLVFPPAQLDFTQVSTPARLAIQAALLALILPTTVLPASLAYISLAKAAWSYALLDSTHLLPNKLAKPVLLTVLTVKQQSVIHARWAFICHKDSAILIVHHPHTPA